MGRVVGPGNAVIMNEIIPAGVSDPLPVWMYPTDIDADSDNCIYICHFRASESGAVSGTYKVFPGEVAEINR